MAFRIRYLVWLPGDGWDFGLQAQTKALHGCRLQVLAETRTSDVRHGGIGLRRPMLTKHFCYGWPFSLLGPFFFGRKHRTAASATHRTSPTPRPATTPPPPPPTTETVCSWKLSGVQACQNFSVVYFEVGQS